MKQKHIVTKIHLIISVLLVIPAACIYGFAPQYFLDISHQTIDERNFSKAIMGIYLAFSILWILGIFKRRFLSFALLSNVLFMMGLGLGRIISLVLDGTPSIIYVIGIFGELLLGFYGLWVLNSKYYKKM
ncbi:DUF4345 domain-containing protein [Winogradskyella algicola]|uniref:DUF4345 domain-containing protein n=1 Tax=Winogradskyella algicola TaxID=2575815 RepID=UPI001107E89F|nr:DUF4345 domain-containing protein [Winogradskyella algicola]